MNSYDFGNAIVMSSAFTDSNNVPTDPTTVTLRIMDPSGVESIFTTPQLTHVGTGVFSLTFPCLKAGVWYYRFEGTGACVATQDNQFVITSTTFPDAAS